MLINLVRNAAEAVLESPPSRTPGNDVLAPTNGFQPSVSIGWKVLDKAVALVIEDNGPGLLNPSNAFVPFYTTKPSGSGIGLILSRQIAEAHGGSLELANRPDERGCRARVLLPRPVL
jgi:two-component system nitrogen regulation sensor histidine kinase NtrY